MAKTIFNMPDGILTFCNVALISSGDCTLQCGMWLWNRDSEFTKWQHLAMWYVALGWHANEFAQTSAILEFYYYYYYYYYKCHGLECCQSHSCGGTLQNLDIKLLHSSMQTSADHRSRRHHVSRMTDGKCETWSPSGMSKVRSRPESLAADCSMHVLQANWNVEWATCNRRRIAVTTAYVGLVYSGEVSSSASNLRYLCAQEWFDMWWFDRLQYKLSWIIVYSLQLLIEGVGLILILRSTIYLLWNRTQGTQ